MLTSIGGMKARYVTWRLGNEMSMWDTTEQWNANRFDHGEWVLDQSSSPEMASLMRLKGWGRFCPPSTTQNISCWWRPSLKESDRFTRRSHITMRSASKHSWEHAAIECMLYPTILEQPGENSGRVEESLCLEHFRREEKEMRKSQLKACYDKKKPPQLKQRRWAIVRYVMTWQEGISRLDRSLHRFRTRVSPISSKLNPPRWCNVSSFVPGIQMILWHTRWVVPYIKVQSSASLYLVRFFRSLGLCVHYESEWKQIGMSP